MNIINIAIAACRLLTADAMDDISITSDQTDDDVVVYSPSELTYRGLRLVNYTKKRLRKGKKKKNIERFKGHFGASPALIAQLWEDLQTTTVEDAHVSPELLDIDDFLMALHSLKRYPTELEREAIFDINEKTGRERVWFWVEKVRALKAEKIRWPEDNFGDNVWAVTVDGVHFWIEEPQHPTWSFDKEFYSHKYAHAGLCCELGISISKSQLVWMNGKFKAGLSDNKIFKNKGLKDKLTEGGKMAIADGGYPGHPNVLSTPNHHDSKSVKLFKSRALKRHEKFNGMIKHFDCLKGRFRHSVDRFESCVEAVCVICQYRMEMGEPLYDVLIDAVVNPK